MLAKLIASLKEFYGVLQQFGDRKVTLMVTKTGNPREVDGLMSTLIPITQKEDACRSS
jgi:hypothetical protein